MMSPGLRPETSMVFPKNPAASRVTEEPPRGAPSWGPLTDDPGAADATGMTTVPTATLTAAATDMTDFLTWSPIFSAKVCDTDHMQALPPPRRTGTGSSPRPPTPERRR